MKTKGSLKKIDTTLKETLLHRYYIFEKVRVSFTSRLWLISRCANLVKTNLI